MVFVPFLAMTKAEFLANPEFSSPVGWMACHFSAYGTGLSNLPPALPKGSLLILNDRTPWWHHDPELILQQLKKVIETGCCNRLLLDFQLPAVPEIANLSGLLTRELNCPVGVSEAYASDLSCPVFLPPVPLDQTLPDHLSPWKDREVWLDLALSSEEIQLTESGCTRTPLPCPSNSDCFLEEKHLHCHYCVSLEEHSARFTLCRTHADLNELLEEAAICGVTTAVGLWQELHSWSNL